MAKKRTLYRSAVTGRFVTAEYAKKRPKTTVAETVRQPTMRRRRK